MELYSPSNLKKTVQVILTQALIGKNTALRFAPERLLADDTLVNAFSPTDVRALTYLGYIGINSPKYKILAKQLSEKNDQMLFALHKDGDKDYTVMTASDISKDTDIITGLTQKDAHMVGMTTASEQTIIEEKQKSHILSLLDKET